MIPWLLHGRLLTGAPGGGVVASPGYRQQLAYALGTSQSTAVATLTINTNGTWATTGTGYATQSGLWYEPSGEVGSGYEVKIAAFNSGGSAGLVSNNAGEWSPLTSFRQLYISASRYSEGTSTAYYNVNVQIRPVGSTTILSDATFSIAVTAQVQATPPSGGGGNNGGGSGCPAVDMWLVPGVMVGDAGKGFRIDGVKSDEPETKVRLAILADQVSLQPCYRMVTAGGAACVLSGSTPFTLRNGQTKYMPAMLGELVLRDDGFGGLAWDEVVQCYPVGEREVMKISVGGHSLLAGEHPDLRIVSHNQQKT